MHVQVCPHGASNFNVNQALLSDGQDESSNESCIEYDDSSCISSSEESIIAPSYSPVQSDHYDDGDDDDDDSDNSDDHDDGLDVLCSYFLFILSYFLVFQSQSCNMAQDNQNSLPAVESPDSSTSCQSTSLIPAHPLLQGNFSFKIIIDNLDMSVKSRFMRVDIYRNKSLHYVNSYAVLGRINFTELPDVHPHTCSNSPDKNALLLLPSADDDKSIRSLFMTHVARVLVSNMKYFKFSFDEIVDWHIKHSYHKEMSARSTVVSNVWMENFEI